VWILTGRVIDDQGIGLASVTIYATAPSQGSAPTPTKTDGSGRYTFDDLRQGHYRLMFVRDGFRPLILDDVFSANPFVAIVDVQLRRAKGD
jgi:carboxypeptidase family protein